MLACWLLDWWPVLGAAGGWVLAMGKAHFSVKRYLAALLRYTTDLPMWIMAKHASFVSDSRVYPRPVPLCPKWARWLVPFVLESVIRRARRAGELAEEWAKSVGSAPGPWVAEAERLRAKTTVSVNRICWVFCISWTPLLRATQALGGADLLPPMPEGGVYGKGPYG